MNEIQINMYIERFSNNLRKSISASFEEILREALKENEKEVVSRITNVLKESITEEKPREAVHPIVAAALTVKEKQQKTLGNLEEKTLDYLKKNPQSTAREVRTGLCLPPVNGVKVSATLKLLHDKKIIVRSGNKTHPVYALQGEKTINKSVKVSAFQQTITDWVKANPGKNNAQIAKDLKYNKGYNALGYHLGRLTKAGLITPVKNKSGGFIFN